MLFFNMVSGPFGQWSDRIILVMANIYLIYCALFIGAVGAAQITRLRPASLAR